MAPKRKPIDPTDRYIPTEYEGTIPPNYYCRAWNGKRKKYCGARAGRGTDHPGTGRCGMGGHDGGAAKRLRHGANVRYISITHERLRHLIEEQEHDPDPLNLFPELAMLRALVIDYINRYDEHQRQMDAWWALFSKRRTDDPRLAAVVEHLLESAPPRKILDIADAYRLLSEIGTTADRVDKMVSKDAVPRRRVHEIVANLARATDTYVDKKTAEKIAKAWLNVPI